MKNGNEKEEIGMLKTLIEQQQIMNRNVIWELQQINEKLSSETDSTIDVNGTRQEEETQGLR